MVGSGLWPTLLPLVFALTMVVAIGWDVATYEIPDSLSVILVVVATAAMVAAGQGWAEVGSHALVGAGAFGLGAALFGFGIWGGGDVKFMAAVSWWLGWPALVGYCFVVALTGGALALVLLVFRRLPLPVSWRGRTWLERLHQADEGLPYGVALGGGGLFVLDSAVRVLLAG